MFFLRWSGGETLPDHLFLGNYSISRKVSLLPCSKYSGLLELPGLPGAGCRQELRAGRDMQKPH